MRCCFLKQIIATHRSSCFADVLQNRYSQKFHYIHRKTSVLESLFIKKKLQHRCFPVNIAKFLRTDFSYRTPMVAASELESNIRLATQILTKTKRRYFYILIIAKQTKQIFLKRYDFFIHFNINENLKKINEKNRCFKPV